MKETVDSTIENICCWIDDQLEDSLTLDGINAVSGMVDALAGLVKAFLGEES